MVTFPPTTGEVGIVPQDEDWVQWFNALALEGLHYSIVNFFPLPLDNPEAVVIREQLADGVDSRLVEIATCLALSLAYHLEQRLLSSYGCRLRFLQVREHSNPPVEAISSFS